MKERRAPELLVDKFQTTKEWDAFDPKGLEPAAKERFNLRRKGIESYVDDGCSLKDSAKTAGVSSAELLRLYRRCKKSRNDGGIVGWRGLVKYAREEYIRRKTIDLDGSVESFAGAFHAILRERPNLKEALDNAISGVAEPGALRLSRMGKKAVYKIFRKACHAEGIGNHQYPLATVNAAYRSVSRYIDTFLAHHPECFKLWYGHAAAGLLRLGSGKSAFSFNGQPYDLVHLDAHRVDVIGTIEIKTQHGPKRVPIRRLWLVVLLDSFSGAILGYSLSYEEQVSAETIEEAIICAQTPWTPRQHLRGGLKYARGSGLPNGMINGLTGCPITVLRMDNFSSHYAKIIQEGARRVSGFHITYGAIGTWWTNARLERLFGVLTQRGIQKYVSSTGSGPQDPLRPLDPGKAAVDEAVDWELIGDEIEVLLTDENVRPGSSRSYMDPLGIIANHVRSNDLQFLPRFSPPLHPTAPRLGWEVVNLPIAGSLKKGNVRRPYIERNGRRYSNDVLSKRFDLIGSHLTAHIKRSNIKVEAYFADGTFVGPLVQLGQQSTVVVSQKTLKMLRKSKNSPYVSEEESLQNHVQRLTDQAAKDADNRPYGISGAASELAKLTQELNHNGATVPDVTASPARPAVIPKNAPAKPMPRLPGAEIVDFSRLTRRR